MQTGYRNIAFHHFTFILSIEKQRRAAVCARAVAEGCAFALIIGAGGLGSALLAYGGFSNYGIDLVAAFDNNPEKCGKEIAGKPVYNGGF